MASPSYTSLFVLCLLVLSVTSQVTKTSAGRQVPAASSDKKQTECLDHEGTVLIPGVGRYMIGSHDTPDITGLDSSGPAAVHSQYIPGNDDTFVPNPGFEVPNPAGGAVSPP
ncbi:putative cell wall protein [Dioscorea cayenensis subsp. rotundata]|uniref:Cell wall protein n=1 Tax=Dioscorea cayennensis subsp. rotundata TaxID=55577 RepID=A0AB40BRU7_DIOCR|nr:putative cell wall protein [Dioscorea cayenensis subsp. rotundata]